MLHSGRMIELEQAVAKILEAVPAPQAEVVGLADAYGRVLLEPVNSPIALPGFNNSAMDGYALRAQDAEGAGTHAPRILRLLGRVAAGEVFAGKLRPGTCVRVFTGSAIPAGADAVVMQEDTRTAP